MVTLPQKLALPMIDDFNVKITVDHAWRRLQEMIANGEATLEGNLVVKGVEGVRLLAESVEEVTLSDGVRPSGFAQGCAEGKRRGVSEKLARSKYYSHGIPNTENRDDDRTGGDSF